MTTQNKNFLKKGSSVISGVLANMKVSFSQSDIVYDPASESYTVKVSVNQVSGRETDRLLQEKFGSHSELDWTVLDASVVIVLPLEVVKKAVDREEDEENWKRANESGEKSASKKAKKVHAPVVQARPPHHIDCCGKLIIVTISLLVIICAILAAIVHAEYSKTTSDLGWKNASSS